MRDAMAATTLALAFSSSEADTIPRIFFWFGQISTQTLNNMMVPSQAPVPIMTAPLPSMKALVKPTPISSSAAAPVNQVSNAAQRNQSNARGATYLPIAAGPGPSLSAAAVASAGV